MSGGTNPTSTFALSNYATQSGTTYPTTMDGNWAVSQRFIDNFAPHAATSPNMTVQLDAGHLFVPSTETLTEVAAQTSATIVAPSGNPRIDRIVINQITGIIQVITGTAASSPSAPALTANTLPIAQVALQTTTTAITNSMITDERALWGVGTGGGFNTEVSIASGSTTDLGATNSNVVVVSGTTTITSFGSSAAISAPIYVVRFLAGVTLTNSANLLCPGATNMLVQAGDSIMANYLGSGIWRIISFTGNVRATTVTAPTITASTALTVSGTLNGVTFASGSTANNGGSNGQGTRYASTSAPSGTGYVNGDLWLQYV